MAKEKIEHNGKEYEKDTETGQIVEISTTVQTSVIDWVNKKNAWKSYVRKVEECNAELEALLPGTSWDEIPDQYPVLTSEPAPEPAPLLAPKTKTVKK